MSKVGWCGATGGPEGPGDPPDADEGDEAIEYLQSLLGWAYGKCMSFGLHNSSNPDTVLKMDEIKLCLTNLRGGDNGPG